jgi:hypothetical protein
MRPEELLCTQASLCWSHFCSAAVGRYQANLVPLSAPHIAFQHRNGAGSTAPGIRRVTQTRLVMLGGRS